MILEQLDIILIVLGGILIAVSFVINFLGTKKITRFSENINRLELLLSEGTAGKKEPSSSSRPAPDSSHNSVFDSSILPAAEIRTPDGKRKTRYRAPGLPIDKLGNIVGGAEAEPAAKSRPAEPAPKATENQNPEGRKKTRYRPPGLHIDRMGNIVGETETSAPAEPAAKSRPAEPAPQEPEKRKPEGKRKKQKRPSGLHIDKFGNIVGEVETSEPAEPAVKPKPAEPEPKTESPEILVEHDTPVQAFSAKAQKTETPLKEAAETADLPEEEKALLKNYLNGPSDVLEETEAPPKPGPGDSRPAKEEESEVMEVIESNQFSSVKRIQDYGLKPVEINPFDNDVQKIDFDKIYETLSGMKTGENLILNFRDILFLIESEYQSLKQLYTKASNKNIILSIKNVSREVKNDILSRISRINFIP